MLSLLARNVAEPSRRPWPNPIAGSIQALGAIPLRPRLFSSSAPSPDKLKSHSGSKKRFFPTAGGLWKRGQVGKRHLNTTFSASRINRLGKVAYLNKTQSKMVCKLLPYA